ncbi:hypothetical protein [Mycobacterium sp. AT1]|uniref:hypothetical protein n=1 Tax=Mycobacterium sp. AT1 TaxID=1961706 RepID=UPI0011503672|nr:hypothetical protein [Mycobacterium sp. AT1]
MGRHSKSSHAPRHAAVTGAGAANYVGRIGALALALGIGAAVAGGAGVAHAEGTTGTDGPKSGSSSQSSTKSSETTKTVKGAGADEAASGGTAVADSPESPGAESTRPSTRKPGSGNGRATKHSSPSATAAQPAADDVTAPAKEAPTTTAVTGSPAASKSTSTTRTGGAPVAPGQVVLGALQLIRREIEGATALAKPAAAVTTVQPNAAAPVAAPDAPRPTDVAHTVYGDIGTWLLQPNGKIANYGGVRHGGKTVLEPVNVIILDPTSTSSAESAARLDAAMTRAGFPAQPIHSTGFSGIINGASYGQQPTGFLQAFSDNFFLFPNDHGRMFGAAPAANGAGYVWSGAFSTEQLNPANPFTHEYVSSETARAALARRLVASGAATVVGVVPLGNAYDDGTLTTGDHDGYAVVLQLTPGVVAVLPRGGVLGSACGHVDDLPGPVGRQLATGVCVVAAQVSTALGLRSVI